MKLCTCPFFIKIGLVFFYTLSLFCNAYCATTFQELETFLKNKNLKLLPDNCIIYWKYSLMIFFVCLRFIVLFLNLSLIWRRQHCRWRAANLGLCSALLLWHGASVFNYQLRIPITHKPIAERLTVELSLPVCNDLSLSQLGFDIDISLKIIALLLTSKMHNDA